MYLLLGYVYLAHAETPAHIALNLRWLDALQWTEFKPIQQQWLDLYRAFLSGDDSDTGSMKVIAANALLVYLL